jgi:hypothetical protein
MRVCGTGKVPSTAVLMTSNISDVKLSASGPDLRLTEKTRVDPEFGVNLVAKLELNLRITLLFALKFRMIDPITGQTHQILRKRAALIH